MIGKADSDSQIFLRREKLHLGTRSWCQTVPWLCSAITPGFEERRTTKKKNTLVRRSSAANDVSDVPEKKGCFATNNKAGSFFPADGLNSDGTSDERLGGGTPERVRDVSWYCHDHENKNDESSNKTCGYFRSLRHQKHLGAKRSSYWDVKQDAGTSTLVKVIFFKEENLPWFQNIVWITPGNPASQRTKLQKPRERFNQRSFCCLDNVYIVPPNPSRFHVSHDEKAETDYNRKCVTGSCTNKESTSILGVANNNIITLPYYY